jgi:ribulose-5-phosphate 4-epimerase/fuculose-1-phosphate aldolase
MRFYNRVGYHGYEGIALDMDEQRRLVEDLGTHDVMILRNHGLLTAGGNVREAFELMYYLELACQIQLDATSSETPLVVPPHEVCEHAAVQFSNSNDFILGRDWAALRRMLDRKEPDYRT